MKSTSQNAPQLPKTKKLRRRWYQYSLRTLFLVMILVSLAMSWLAVRRQHVLARLEIIKAVKANGAMVFYTDGSPHFETNMTTQQASAMEKLWTKFKNDYFPPDPVSVRWFFSAQPPKDDNLRQLAELPSLEDINLAPAFRDRNEKDMRGTIPVSNKGLAHLGKMDRLKMLELDCTQIADSGLQHIEMMKQLVLLTLRYTDITNAGLKSLAELPNLQHLDLSGTRITDGGLEHLEKLSKLRRLDLDHTQITDAGLDHLDGLSSLECLSLCGAQATDQGVKKLQKALPNLTILR